MTTARQALRMTALLRNLAWLLLLALAMLTAACGGGDPEESPDQPTPTVDCSAHPGACK